LIGQAFCPPNIFSATYHKTLYETDNQHKTLFILLMCTDSLIGVSYIGCRTITE